MLVISRKLAERVVLFNGDIETKVEVVDIRGESVRLGIHAPEEIVILREEIAQAHRDALKANGHPTMADQMLNAVAMLELLASSLARDTGGWLEFSVFCILHELTGQRPRVEDVSWIVHALKSAKNDQAILGVPAQETPKLEYAAEAFWAEGGIA